MAVGSSSWPFTLVLLFCDEKDGVVLEYPFPLLLSVGEEDGEVVLSVLYITVTFWRRGQWSCTSVPIPLLLIQENSRVILLYQLLILTQEVGLYSTCWRTRCGVLPMLVKSWLGRPWVSAPEVGPVSYILITIRQPAIFLGSSLTVNPLWIYTMHGHEAWTCSMYGHAAWTHSMNMKHGQAAWTSSTDLQHGNAARTCSMDMQYGHTARTCSVYILQGHTA
jgi:hypothetical protein